MKKLSVAIGVLLAVVAIALLVLRSRVEGMKRKPVLYIHADMDAAEHQADVVYKKVGSLELRMDLYRPVDAQKPPPAVLLIHGGGPEFFIRDAKDWKLFETWARLLAARGLVGVTFNHRASSDYSGLEDEAADVWDALNHVRDHADELGVDGDRLALFAFSAGGVYLARALRERPAHLRALVACDAVMDLDAAEGLVAEGVDATLRERHSPAGQLSRGPRPIAPTLLVQAGQDRAEINTSIEAFVAAAKAASQPVQHRVHEQGRHAFDMLDDDDHTRELIGETLDFLVEQLGSTGVGAGSSPSAGGADGGPVSAEDAG